MAECKQALLKNARRDGRGKECRSERKVLSSLVGGEYSRFLTVTKERKEGEDSVDPLVVEPRLRRSLSAHERDAMIEFLSFEVRDSKSRPKDEREIVQQVLPDVKQHAEPVTIMLGAKASLAASLDVGSAPVVSGVRDSVVGEQLRRSEEPPVVRGGVDEYVC